jgi:hypothetical protein
MMMPITSTEKKARRVAGGAAAAARESWPIMRSGYMAAAKPVIVSVTVHMADICANRNRHLQSSIMVVIPEITDMATKGAPREARRRSAKRGASTMAMGISTVVRKPSTSPAIIP